MKPIWFLNMLAVLRWDEPLPYLSSLALASPWIDEYLDKTLVAGDEDAKAIVRVCYKMFNRFCKWKLIKTLPNDSTQFQIICKVAKRLEGLKTVAFS